MFIIAGSRMRAATWSPMPASTRSSRSASLNAIAFVSSVTACGWPPPNGTLPGSSRGPRASSGGRTETITASWGPWEEPSIFSTRSRPVAPRARCTASIVDSVPEFVKRHCGRPKRRRSSRATTIEPSVGAAKCEAFAARSVTARTMAGLAWPTHITPKPLWKSTYSLPSTSHTFDPSPWERYVGRGSAAWKELGTPRGMTVTARSNAACDPGVRSSSAARSRSMSSRRRARSIVAAEVVAMPRSVRPPAAARRGVNPLPRSAGAAGHRRQDDERVGAADRRLQAVEDAHVLVVQIDVHVAVEPAVLGEQLRLRLGVRVGQRVEHRADVVALGRDLALAAGRRAQDGWDLDLRHEGSAAYLAGGGAERLVVREDAHLLVGDLGGVPRADRALGVAADLELGGRRSQRVVHEQAADERVAGADDQLHDLGRLEQAHRARQHAEHAVRAARRGELVGRRLREQAAVARAVVRLEDAKLPLEAEDRGRHDRDLEAHRRVVEQVARGEVVDAVDDDVPALDDLHDVRGVEARLVLDDLHVGVQRLDLLLGRVDLRHADAVGGVDHLARQCRDVDEVVVEDAERADAGGGEVERGRRAEAAGAEQQYLRVEQLLLPLDADLREQKVARVALALLGGEGARDLDLVAAVLPQRDAAGHRLDVLVAELLPERVGGQRGAVARGAVQDDALRAVRDRALDAGLEVAARHVLGAGQMTDRVLLGLAHVDDRDPHQRRVAVLVAVAVAGAIRCRDELVDLGGVDLLDLLLDAAGVLRSAHAHSGIP